MGKLNVFWTGGFNEAPILTWWIEALSREKGEREGGGERERDGDRETGDGERFKFCDLLLIVSGFCARQFKAVRFTSTASDHIHVFKVERHIRERNVIYQIWPLLLIKYPVFWCEHLFSVHLKLISELIWLTWFLWLRDTITESWHSRTIKHEKSTTPWYMT